jgi:signal transduction histidine kinase
VEEPAEYAARGLTDVHQDTAADFYTIGFLGLDGDGITPETQRRLFGRFVRGENAQGKAEGSGLGLNIAQWIVQAHGGTIALQSEPGKKTVVVVRLPLARTTTEAPEASARDISWVSSAGGGI